MSNATTTLAQSYGAANPLTAIKARIFAFGLDRKIADGADVWSTPTLAARGQYLVSENVRRTVAKELVNLVDQLDVRSDRISFSATVSPTSAVRTQRAELLRLSARLTAERAPGVRGIAALRNLLTDGSGPFYHEVNGQDLEQRLEEIDGWLTARS